MARSPTDDPRFNDKTWNYHVETGENCAPGGMNEMKQGPLPSGPSVSPENMFGRNNFANDVYNKPYMQATDRDDKNAFTSIPNVNRDRINRQSYGNAMLNLGNGQMVRVFYDENNQQLIFPMSGQYELFNHNQGLVDVPIQAVPPAPSHLFTLNQEFINNNALVQPMNIQHSAFNQESANQQTNTTSNFLKEVLGNWEPNVSGTYSPFGQNYPLNIPETPIMSNHNGIEPNFVQMKPENSPKRNENGPLADTSTKKRIVAEVKPMRPSYSDVLAKNTKNTSVETKKVKPQNSVENKTPNKLIKTEKPSNIKQPNDDAKKTDKKHSTISSGSESGDINADDTEKQPKTNKKSKNRRNNMSRKWSSMDDITNEEGSNQEESQFIFIKDEKQKKDKKSEKPKNDEQNDEEDDFNLDEDEETSQFVLQEGQIEGTKSRKKKERTHHKSAKVVQDKKKGNQAKVRRNKPGYMGLVQNHLERWGGASWKAVVWFLYLLSDICRMSLHLSFDL